jgi:hypothetical protein
MAKSKYKNAEWKKIKLVIPEDKKDIHEDLRKTSKKMFKLLEEAGAGTELQLVWRAAISHALEYTGFVPLTLNELQRNKLEVYDWMKVLVDERVNGERKQNFIPYTDTGV